MMAPHGETSKPHMPVAWPRGLENLNDGSLRGDGYCLDDDGVHLLLENLNDGSLRGDYDYWHRLNAGDLKT